MTRILMRTLCATVFLSGLASTALAETASMDHSHSHEHHHHHHDGPAAPIGVMRDHVHEQGGWMLSYRFAYMHMEGNRDGASSVSDQEVLNDFMVAPTEMPMIMHMLGAMYGVTDEVTVSVMGGFADREMDHIRRDGSTFTMENDGITDTSVNVLYEFFNNGKHRVQLNAGVSLPTGSSDDRKPNGGIFGYPMQMGSGTYDLLPGISYSGVSGDWSWGSQANTTIRLGQNDRGYSLGNRIQLTGWGARQLNDMFSVSLRLDGQAWENIDGTDRDLTGPMFMAPPLDASRQAGERIEALVGVNFTVPNGPLKGHRLATEFGMPLYESLDGPRLETDYRVILGWQAAF